MFDITSLPPLSHASWRGVASGKITKPWSALAVRIMMTRICSETRRDPSSANIDKCAQEIRSFYAKNLQIAQTDLRAIFG
jgi:hypothetical protein